MLGKTFKGLTDAMLQLADRAAARAGDERARSTGWTSGRSSWSRSPSTASSAARATRAASTLRFARVLRYRPDKRADEADTLEAVRTIHAGT